MIESEIAVEILTENDISGQGRCKKVLEACFVAVRGRIFYSVILETEVRRNEELYLNARTLA